VTEHRRPQIRFSEAPRATCRWCGTAIVHEDGPKRGEPDRRRRWHQACVDDYNASDPREARRLIRKRDRGRCAECGLDTDALKRELRGRGRSKKLRERGFKARGSLWELDHILPLIDGGSHEPANLQTLCTPCHKRKTALEARERSARRQQDCAPSHAPDAEEQPTRPADDTPESPTTRAEPDAETEADKRGVARPALPRDLDALLDRAAEINARVEAYLEDFRSRPGD
jgi:5-methylcytosine-specific restriction endonuclease McrA